MAKPPNAPAAEVAATLFAALNDRDLDRAASLWRPDLVEDFVAIGEFRGPAAARRFFEELFTAVPDFVLTIDRILAEDANAVIQWRAAGTFTGGPFQGVHATGRSIELRGVDVMHVVDGLLARNTIYYDGLALARQIGLLPSAQSTADRALTTGFNAKTDLLRRLTDVRAKRGTSTS